MEVAGFDVQFVSHVCFHITSPGGATVLTDPLFAESFIWQGQTERYLSRPDITADDIRRCDAIFVSHVHGDHFDPDAIEIIVGNTGAEVWAPSDVIEALRRRAIEPRRLVTIGEGNCRQIADATATFYAGYDGSLDEEVGPNKFSFLLEAGGRSIFYSGDCHDPPPAMIGRTVDSVFAWAHPEDETLEAFLRAIPCRQYVLMHGDRFAPGDFFCNMDLEAERRRVLRLAPQLEVVIPGRICSPP